jgi:hypothetical protein
MARLSKRFYMPKQTLHQWWKTMYVVLLESRVIVRNSNDQPHQMVLQPKLLEETERTMALLAFDVDEIKRYHMRGTCMHAWAGVPNDASRHWQ